MGHGVGQAVDPHFDPHLKVHFCNEKHPKSEDFRCFLELLTRFELVTSSLPKILVRIFFFSVVVSCCNFSFVFNAFTLFRTISAVSCHSPLTEVIFI